MRAHVTDDVGYGGDRIPDELAGAVVGELAAAVDVDDLDSALARTSARRTSVPIGSLRRPRV